MTMGTLYAVRPPDDGGDQHDEADDEVEPDEEVEPARDDRAAFQEWLAGAGVGPAHARTAEPARRYRHSRLEFPW